jgi:periplasmic protein TonB
MAGFANQLRRYLPLAGIAVLVAAICGGLAWMVYGAMQVPVTQTKKVVTQVNVIRPPPPPEVEELPEPEVEEEVEIVEPEEAMPEPDLAEIPDGPLGLDAEGAAGLDGFGLAARKGGRDITAAGDPYGWYRDLLRNDLSERLADIESIRRDAYEVDMRLWLDPQGKVKRVKLMESTGDSDLDRELERALASLDSVSEAPPPGLESPIRLRFICRT